MSTRLGVALLIVSAFFFSANFADKAWLSYQVRQQKQQQLARIAEVKREISQYRHDLAYLHSRAYYVQAARAYGYVLPGDTQIQLSVSNVAQSSPPATVLTSQLTQPATPKHKSTLSFWQRWLQAAATLIVPGL